MASSPVASETGTMGSFTVIGSDLDTGIDYMLLEGTDQAMDPVEPAQDMELDPARNKDTLAAQLHEMEKVMASLGLDPKPDEGVAASCAKPETGSVPAGFVAAAAPAQSPQHPDPSELTVALVFDSQKETFTLEGWETLVPAMPATASKFFRGITHGELSALLEAFKNSTWTAALIAKIAETITTSFQSSSATSRSQNISTYSCGHHSSRVLQWDWMLQTLKTHRLFNKFGCVLNLGYPKLIHLDVS